MRPIASTTLVLVLGLGLPAAAAAATLQARVRLVTPDGPGAPIGRVVIRDTAEGAVFDVDLHGLPPGLHGFHVHAMGSCAPGPDKSGMIVGAGGAGGHMDPTATGKHEGPTGFGHLGDLPALNVGPDGAAKVAITASRVTSVADLAGHALMIHAGGDNYSDVPAPLGGGGPRIACGVIG